MYQLGFGLPSASTRVRCCCKSVTIRSTKLSGDLAKAFLFTQVVSGVKKKGKRLTVAKNKRVLERNSIPAVDLGREKNG